MEAKNNCNIDVFNQNLISWNGIKIGRRLQHNWQGNKLETTHIYARITGVQDKQIKLISNLEIGETNTTRFSYFISKANNMIGNLH